MWHDKCKPKPGHLLDMMAHCELCRSRIFWAWAGGCVTAWVGGFGVTPM